MLVALAAGSRHRTKIIPFFFTYGPIKNRAMIPITEAHPATAWQREGSAPIPPMGGSN